MLANDQDRMATSVPFALLTLSLDHSDNHHRVLLVSQSLNSLRTCLASRNLQKFNEIQVGEILAAQ